MAPKDEDTSPWGYQCSPCKEKVGDVVIEGGNKDQMMQQSNGEKS